MQFNSINWLFILLLSVFLSACGNGDSDQQKSGEQATQETRTDSTTASESTAASTEKATSGPGDPANGETLYKKPTIGGVPGCVTCHSLNPGTRLIGPSLADAATKAAGNAEGMSAEAFLRESIVDPDAHVTEGFSKGLMYQRYGKDLSQQQINDLVAFLLTQK